MDERFTLQLATLLASLSLVLTHLDRSRRSAGGGGAVGGASFARVSGTLSAMMTTGKAPLIGGPPAQDGIARTWEGLAPLT